jgi:hypothetical protein
VTPPIDLGRTRSVSELLDASFRLWWQYRAVFFTLALIIVAPVAIVAAAVLHNIGHVKMSDATLNDVSPLFIVVVLTLIEIPLITASFARAVERIGAGESVSVGESLRAGVAVFGAALAAILLALLVALLAAIPLILPGIYLAVRLAFAGQAAAVERTGARAALRTSMLLTKGRFWNLLGILTLVTFGGFVAASVVEAPFSAIGGTPALAATAIVSSAVNSITALVLTLVYFDLKARFARQPVAPVEAAATPETL